MANYSILDCELPLTENGEALMKIGNTFQLGDVWSWKSGQRFEPDETTFETPVRIPFEPLRGYLGPPVELLDLGIPIMSKRLRDAIVGAGVSNVEWFEALIENNSTGAVFEFLAFNVVGLVAAADLAKSQYSAEGKPVADVSFDELVLDEKRTQGALFFRLAENVNALLVHERVRRSIEAAGIDTVKFVAPEDWVQV